MPAGLQVWDASGTLVFDTTTQSGRLLGSVDASSDSGSISVDFSNGVPFAFPIMRYPGGQDFSFSYPSPYVRQPVITLTSSSLSWQRDPDTDGAPSADCVIFYGVY